MSSLLPILFLILAYMIGSISFGLILVKRLTGQDLRQVGSGNIGATNVRRVLGWKGFFVVLFLDAFKGWGPVVGFPLLLTRIDGSLPPTWLPPTLAVAAILGHNFPVFLRFRGGKGVATSLGAVLGLDPIGVGLAIIGCLICLGLTRWMSLSSLVGGAVFLLHRVLHVGEPFSPENITSSLVFLFLYAMMVVKHRSNLKRIIQGTEPKLWSCPPQFGDTTPKSRSGSVVVGLIPVVTIVVLAIVVGSGLRLTTPGDLTTSGISIQPVERLSARWQRAAQLTWWRDGSRLVVAHPRFNRLAIHEWNPANEAVSTSELVLEGRPEAIACDPSGKIPSLVVLQSAGFEGVHLEPGWIQAFDPLLNRLGERFPIGDYPKDLVLLPHLKAAAVLTAGRAEGDPDRPPPQVTIVRFDDHGGPCGILGSFELTNLDDHPQRLAVHLDESTVRLAIACFTSRRVLWVDASDPSRLRELGSTSLTFEPGGVSFAQDRLLIAAQYEGAIAIADGPTSTPRVIHLPETELQGDITFVGADFCLVAHPRRSVLSLVDLSANTSTQSLSVRGFANLTGTRPHFMALDRQTGRLAVANYSGGSVHLFTTRLTPPSW